MALKLPTYQWRNAVVDRLGMATLAFQRFLGEFTGAIERNEAGQEALLIQIQQVQADIISVLNGTLPFTALNITGTNVEPFLNKTDGTMLVDNSGLAPNVVTTPKLNAGAANQVIIASNTTVALPAGVDTVVLTVVITTVAGETVDLAAQFSHLEISSPTSRPRIIGSWVRNGIVVVPVAVIDGIDVTRAADPDRYVLNRGVLTAATSDIPGAGTHTYELIASCSVSASAGAPYARLLTATRP